MGTGKTIQTFDIEDISGGVNYADDITALTKAQSPDSMNVEFINGRWRKRKGFLKIATSVGGNAAGNSLIDFGSVSGEHKQVAHLGDNVYAYTGLTSTRATLRVNAPRTRSYNAKVRSYLVQTYNDYSVPYYWDGSASTMTALSVNAPNFKRCIEFQGYCMGMNTETYPMRIYYQTTSNMVGAGAAWADYFTLTPAPNDDQISDPFLLNGRLYVGTGYGIFRISFVGGVTVFEFKQVISDVGIIPNTVQLVVTKEFGQIALFMGTDKRVYMFDGANMKVISDLFYFHNSDTPISLDLIDDRYRENSFAVYDSNKRVYRLFCTRIGESQNNYALNIDVDTFAYYPFNGMNMTSGYMCFDSIRRAFLCCADYTGQVNKMFIDYNSDNGTAINEYYTSPQVSVKDPYIKQGQNIIMHMAPLGGYNMLVYDRVDFARSWSLRQRLPMASSRDKFLGTSFVLGSAVLGSEKAVIHPQIGINVTFNHYQFKIAAETPTAPAWELYSVSVNQNVLVFGEAEPQR